MSDYITEQEQIQQLKNWLKEYGLSIIAGILIAVVISVSWHYWQAYRDRILTHASGVYDEMLTLRAQSNTAGSTVQAEKLLSHYPNTPYAQMAAMMLARNAVLKKNYPEAITQLTWVLDHGKDASIREIARLRIARILIAEKKPEAALELLKTIDDKNFNGLINEVKGDAYLAMNNAISAKQSYELALKEQPNAEIARPVLQMKADNVTTTNESSV